MKIVIIGGHLSPALAVIEKLKTEEVSYIGRKYTFEGDKAISLEYLEITKLGIPFYEINTARLQRKFTKRTISSLAKFPAGFFQALKILKQIQPNVVVGFGGYVSVPVILAAAFLKITIIIHEQTLEIGLANKIAAKFAKKICISWETSRKYFPESKTVLTGNPLQTSILNSKPKTLKNNLPVLYFTGGSSGSHALNLLVEESLSKLLKQFRIIQQTGDAKEFGDFDRLQIAKNRLNANLDKNYHLQKFYTPEESVKNLQTADLVIGRAGINTVTELIYFAKPAFLIPLPFAQKDEQLKNALFLKELGLGELALQKNLTAEIFQATISKMFINLANYKLKKNVLIPNASENIVKIIKDVSFKKTT